MRCLPLSKLRLANGRCLHDWHAEIVAIRAFNLYLLDECERLVKSSQLESEILRRCAPADNTGGLSPPFAIKNDIRIHMYSSEAPCGDASMELTMEAQEDATPWPDKNDELLLNGRGHFSKLGVVRRNPSRADAPIALSKSCSDKLAMKECTSLLSSVTSLLVHPGSAYLHQLVVPRDQFVPEAFRRSFSAEGRMAPCIRELEANKCWKEGYRFRPFDIATTSKYFNYSRRGAAVRGNSIGSNIAAMWMPTKQEVIIGGTIQGHKHFAKQGASAISRARLWGRATSVAINLGSQMTVSSLKQSTYSDVKNSALLTARRGAKDTVKKYALHGWVSNASDDFSRPAEELETVTA